MLNWENVINYLLWLPQQDPSQPLCRPQISQTRTLRRDCGREHNLK